MHAAHHAAARAQMHAAHYAAYQAQMAEMMQRASQPVDYIEGEFEVVGEILLITGAK